MRKSTPVAILLGLVAALAVVGAVSAHAGEAGEESLVVEPGTVEADGSVVLAGSGLEPDNDRVLVLAGEGILVEFETVKTDAEGMFQQELVIPAHLPSGTYELRAIGDETLTVPLGVTAVAGGAEASAPPETEQAVAARERTPVELAGIIVVVAVAALAGGFLVLRAERLGGHGPALPGG